MSVATNTPSVTDSDPEKTVSKAADVRLSVHFNVGDDEPIQFLKSVSDACHSGMSQEFHGPSAQDLECLRQAAWKYGRQMATPTVSGEDIAEVLVRLGYM